MKLSFLRLPVWAAALFVFCHFSLADGPRPDQHAPIGVMGDHAHAEGEFMLSFRSMYMHMDGNRDGTRRVRPADLLRNSGGQYRVAPIDMDMEMHMLGLMYAPSDTLTLMAMLPWVSNSMDHVTAMGGEFTTESSALGDASISALVSVADDTLLTLGLSLPTGDQDQRDHTPMGRAVLPYPMQIGAGTYGLIAGIGTTWEEAASSRGVQLRGLLPVGENDEGYRPGEEFSFTSWYAWHLTAPLSISLRGSYLYSGNYHGADDRYTAALQGSVVPTVDPDLRGGQRVDVGIGINLAFHSGHRLAVEYQVPVWQDLDGPQLETDSVLTLGWQFAF